MSGEGLRLGDSVKGRVKTLKGKELSNSSCAKLFLIFNLLVFTNYF